MWPLVYSIFIALSAFFLIVIGLLGVIVPWSDAMREGTLRFLEDNWIAFFLFGIGFLTVGIALFSYFVGRLRRRYYSFASDQAQVSVDEKLIEEYARRYWQKRFPDKEIACRVRLRRRDLLVIADLPFVPQEEQQALLEEAQSELYTLLHGATGYESPLRLNASFGE